VEQEGFLTDLRTATLFFRLCRRFHIDHPEDRVLLLRELTRRRQATYLRDVEKFVAGKRVLKIKSKPPHNAGPEHRCPQCEPWRKKDKQ
jgi:hypothetical protein